MASLVEVPEQLGCFTYGTDIIDYRITRNERLTTRVRVHIHPDATVELECPVDAGEDQIRTVLSRRGRWIWRNMAEIASGRAHARPREYVSGETHFYLGRRHQLKVITDKTASSSVKLSRGRLEVRLPISDPAAVHRRLSAWYRKRADEYFAQRLRLICADLPWVSAIPEFSLLRMRRQWGSCSPAGTLILNPALIKAPRPCIDYVLKHELCHLAEHNHSPRFYDLLTRIAPSWKTEREALDRIAELILVS